MKSFMTLVLLTPLSFMASAQNQFGILPVINTSIKLQNEWKLNTKLEGRQLFKQHPFPKDESQRVFERVDLEVVANKTLNAAGDLGFGYLLRRQDGKFIHRFIQQYAYTKKLYSSRLSHRFRTDQTFDEDEAVQFRLRYRASWEKPLNGLQVDPKEYYLKLNNEYLASMQYSKDNLEIRGLAVVGYTIGEDNRIEAGVDYRLEQVFSQVNHKLFLNIGFYHNF
jgi:hypothetical protein